MRGVSANPPAGEQPISELKARIEAERSGQPFLLYTDGEGRQQLFSFAPGVAEASIGRERSTDIVLGWDAEVSRLHARLERAEEDWTVVDDGLSSNGTFVNDRRISGRVRLNDGDTLRLGATSMTFRAPPAGRQAGAAAPGESPAEVDLSTTQRRVLAALCRPYRDGTGPAGDEQIAEELFLSVDSVRTHLMVLFAKLGVDQVPRDQQRIRLVEKAVYDGLISERDL
jgi:pSer/pThr/pTyr-binding forkhead associated (FHA) protein